MLKLNSTAFAFLPLLFMGCEALAVFLINTNPLFYVSDLAIAIIYEAFNLPPVFDLRLCFDVVSCIGVCLHILFNISLHLQYILHQSRSLTASN